MNSRILLTLLLFCCFSNVTIAQNLALSGVASHSGGGSGLPPTGYGPENYNDNVITSPPANTPWGWVSTNGWIEYTWSTPQAIGKVVFYKSNRPFTSATIEYWNGSSYTFVSNYTSLISTFEDSVMFLNPIVTTKIRFSTVAGSSNPNFREIQVYGPGKKGYNNANTEALVNPVKPFCPGNHTVTAKIKNKGLNRINNVRIYWEVDGVLQPVVNYNGMIDTIGGSSADNVNVPLGSLTFAGGVKNIKVYTSIPNGIVDTVNSDDTLYVSLSASPYAAITATGPTIFCTAGTINVGLKAPTGAGNLYQWFKDGVPISGANNVNYQATQAGDYTVRIDSNGCQNTSPIIRVDNLAMPLPLVHPAGYPVLCDGDSMTLIANAGITGATYQWQFQGADIIGATNASYTATTPGNYNVITTKYICNASSAGVTIVSATLPTPLISQLNDGTLATDPTFVDYQWMHNGLDIPGATNFAHKPTQPGNYTVRVSNGGCDNTSPVHAVGTTGIATTTAKENSISIYPNPTTSVLYINAPFPINYSILNIDGKEVVSHSLDNNKIDIGHLPPSVYIIKISGKDGTIMLIDKIIKTN